MNNFSATFESGDRVTLAREDTRMQAFAPGEVLILKRFDPGDNTWLAYRPTSPENENWVGQEFLQHPVSNDELDRQAQQLFGVIPMELAEHCKTCRCPK